MAKNTKFNFFYLYKILLTVSIIVSGICLICGCAYIFFSGNGYSREIVAKTFSKIALPIFICLILLLCSIIVELFNNKDKKKYKFYKPENFKQNNEPKISTKSLFIIKVIIISLGIVSLILGAVFGGFADVLTKAVNICTECIGLG